MKSASVTSIRTRLTIWNSGILLFILCVAGVAGYLLLRESLVAQLDRAVSQQMSVILATVNAMNGQHESPSDVATLISDLKSHGVLMAQSPVAPNVVVAAPIRVDEEDEHDQEKDASVATLPKFDWQEMLTKAHKLRDDDEAYSVSGSHGGVRVLTKAVALGGSRLTVFATQPQGQAMELLESARTDAFIALPTALLLATLVGYLLARRALAPIAEMTADARRIGARNAHERLTVQDPGDELGQLSITINDMLKRMEDALEQQRRFTADASHELRTPVALIRAEADVALADDDGAPTEQANALRVIRDSSRNLSRIVNDLFLLARADAGQTLAMHSRFALDELVKSCVNSMRLVASRHDISFEVDAASSIEFVGDADLLRRAICNLLDNAIKYSTGGGRVRITLERSPNAYTISVVDSGEGISVDDQSHIFERFYRGDQSRTRSKVESSTGAGLGLAIAREIAELHDGTLELAATGSSGSTFVIALPFASNRTTGDVL